MGSATGRELVDEPWSAVDEIRWVGQNRRRVFAGDPQLDQLIAFALGYDLATGYRLLDGFSDWLVSVHGSGRNIHWSGHVRSYCYEVDLGNRVGVGARSPEQEEQACDRFFELLDRFMADEEPSTLGRT